MAIYDVLKASRYQEAGALIDEILPFEELRAEENNGTDVTMVKAALKRLGEDCGAMRPPAAWPLTDAASERLNKLLRAWGLTPKAETMTPPPTTWVRVRKLCWPTS